MTDVLIEPARPSDFGAVKQLLTDCGLPSRDLTESHLGHFFVVRSGESITAVVGLEPSETGALLRSLAVRPTARRHGVATALVQHTEAYARSLGADTIFLLTQTAESFFAKLGYEATSRNLAPPGIQKTQQFQSLCSNGSLCMFKDINPAVAAARPRNLFVYGTLIVPEILEEVVGRQYRMIPAFLKDYARFRIKDERYPAITPVAGAVTDGFVCLNVDRGAFEVLDHFEGDPFQRLLVRVVAEDTDLQAFTYVMRPGREDQLTSESWSPEEFRRDHAAAFLRTYRGFADTQTLRVRRKSDVVQ
jgi:amino-acid N-acetyltransferase